MVSMISNSHFRTERALLSNTSSSIQKSLVSDALQRPAHKITGLPADSSSQLLPPVDPRIPTVGQHVFGVYETYVPPIQIPDWRSNRVQREATTPLQRELALEEQAALERLRNGVAHESKQWTSGGTDESAPQSDASIPRNPAGFRLVSARSRRTAGATGSQTLDANPTPMQINQQKIPATAQQTSETSRERLTVKPSELINRCVNVDRAPTMFDTNAR